MKMILSTVKLCVVCGERQATAIKGGKYVCGACYKEVLIDRLGESVLNGE